MAKPFCSLLLVLSIAFCAVAQQGNRQINTAVSVSDVEDFRMPARVDDVSFFGGCMHFVTGGMLMSSSVDGSKVATPSVDSAMVAIDPMITYAVVDPFTNALYYTKTDSKNHSDLYIYYEKKPGKFTTRKVKLPGFSSSIMHPVFSSDGLAMVFVSDSPLGFGGYDLWFTIRHDGEWKSPQNMGHRINTGGDEIMPAMYGDFMVFSSNGRPDSYGGFDLYASRLVALRQTSDTVMMYPIGRCPVYSLQAPFCSADDDLGFVSSGTSGFWLRRTSEGVESFSRFDGRLDCVKMQGTITSPLYDKVEGAYAVAGYSPRPGAPLSHDTVAADAGGNYILYLRPGFDYDLSFYAVNHFVARQHLVPARPDEDNLYALTQNDVRLEAFSLDSLINYPDLFSSSVSSELSPAGRAHVDTLARFLVENPQLHITVYSAYNLSAEIPFCALVNASRLRSLTDYLVSRGVDAKRVATSTNIPSHARRQSNASVARDLSPVASSSLTSSFAFSK